MRDLRNHGGEIVDRVVAGEALLVTRSGKPVAELIPVRRAGLRAEELLRRWRSLPPVDATTFRDDLDAVLDASL